MQRLLILVLISSLISCKHKQPYYWVSRNHRVGERDSVWFFRSVLEQGNKIAIRDSYGKYKETFILDLKANSGIYHGMNSNLGGDSVLKLMNPVFLKVATKQVKVIPLFLDNTYAMDDEVVYYWSDSLGIFYTKSLAWGNGQYLVTGNKTKDSLIHLLYPLLDKVSVNKLPEN